MSQHPDDSIPTFISLSDLDLGNQDVLTERQRNLLSLGRMFIQLEQAFAYSLQVYAERHGLTVLEARALQAIHEMGDDAKLGSIAERIMAPLSTMTGIASRLQQHGLAERLRAEDDRRAFVLRLTPEGRARTTEFFTEFYTDFGKVVETVGEDGIAAIVAGFHYALDVTLEFEEFARNKCRGQ